MKLLSARQTSALYVILHLLSYWSEICQGTVKCPDHGWSCSEEGDKLRRFSTLPGTEGVEVAFSPTKVYIKCRQFSGTKLVFPTGFLRGWTFNSTYYQFIQCPVPLDQTYMDILKGGKVESLQLSGATPLGDTLKAEIFNGLTELQSLSITESGLSTLPKDLFSALPKLTTVSLKSNHLTHLPQNTFAAIKALKYLDLSDNNFTEMIEAKEGLKHLEKIYLYHNEIERLSRTFFASMPTIKIVDLQDNRLANLSSDLLHDVPALESLKLFKNKLTEIPPNFLQFHTQITELDISDNPRLNFLPSNLLLNLTKLRYLNLQRCNLQNIPSTFFHNKHLSTLTTLLLSRNNLSDLNPATFRKLTNLVTLDLCYNQLKNLPQGVFSGLQELKTLRLDRNQLTSIPPSIFNSLSKMTAVYLQYNSLSNLFMVFDTTTALKHLDLSRNNLNFSNENPFTVPLSIEEIVLSYNKIEVLPCAWMTANQNLTKLNLSYNLISAFDVMQCSSTSDNMILDLTNNQITTINMRTQMADYVANTNKQLSSKSIHSTVRLGHNPYRCDCNARDLLTYYSKQGNQQYPFIIEIEDLICNSPSPLVGQPVVQLTMEQLRCELTPCENLCDCFKYANGTIIVDCSHQALSQLPIIAPPATSVLRLNSNNLNTISGIESPLWANVSKLEISNNHISVLNVNILPENLKHLDLGGNQLTSLSKETLKELDTRPNMTILLQRNPWSCKCEDAGPFKMWLYENANRIGNMSNIHCNNTNQPLHLHDVCPLSSVSTKDIMVGATVISLVLAIGLATIGIGYYRYRQQIKIWLYSRHWCLWFVTENEIDRDKTYDAFVSFSQEDSEFVALHLAPGLEHGEPPYKLCIHYRDWLAGEWIPDQIIRSVQDSRRTIVVLSKNFIRSVWGRLEFKAAHHQALQDQKNRIIIIVFGDLPPQSEMDPELRMYVKFNTYLKWGDPWFWQKMRYAMPHNPLNMPPMRSSSTLSTLSSSFSEEPRISISSSVLNGMSEDKMELV